MTNEQLVEQLRELSNGIDTIYWEICSAGAMTEEQAQNLLSKIVDLYKLHKYSGRHKFKYLVSRYRNRLGSDKLLALLVAVSLIVNDSMTHKLVTRAVVVRQKLETVSGLVSTRTNTTINLTDVADIKPIHIECLNDMIKHLGMHDIYADFMYNKNLLYLANINDELAATLESHMLMKARRYKNFFNLVQYLDAFPKADKRKFFVEIFKHKKCWNAKIAMERLQKHPELQKYFLMK